MSTPQGVFNSKYFINQMSLCTTEHTPSGWLPGQDTVSCRGQEANYELSGPVGKEKEPARPGVKTTHSHTFTANVTLGKLLKKTP